MGETRRAFTRPPMRPYLPGRAHLRRILRGAVILARMAWRAGRAALRRATAPPKPEKAKTTDKSAEKDAEKTDKKRALADELDRGGAALLIVVVAGITGAGAIRAAWPILHPYAPVLGSVLVGGLLTAAWVVGPEEQDEPGDGAGEKAPKTPGPATDGGAAQLTAPSPVPTEPLTADRVATVVRQIATPRGWKGAHLDDVLAHLPGRSREELLQVLADARIPVTEQLKLTLPGGKQRNRQGIRLSVLPAAPNQAPAGPATTPPQQPALAPPEPAPRPVPVTVYGAE